MLDRKAIAAVMKFALGRLPEEVAYMRCQAVFADINGLIESLIASEEFKARSWHAAAAKSRSLASERTSWRGEPSDIDWAYKTLLKRPPENYAIIAAWLLESPTREEVVERFITSEEFKSDAWHAAAAQVRAEFAKGKAPGAFWRVRPLRDSKIASR